MPSIIFGQGPSANRAENKLLLETVTTVKGRGRCASTCSSPSLPLARRPQKWMRQKLCSSFALGITMAGQVVPPLCTIQPASLYLPLGLGQLLCPTYGATAGKTS